MRYEIRQLDVGGILDQAISLTKNHFGLFFKIALVFFVSAAAFGLVAVWAAPAQMAIPSANAGDFLQRTPHPIGPIAAMGLLGLVLTIVVRPLTNAAVIYAVASSYLEMPISVGIAFRRAWRIYLPMLGTGILAFLLIMLGCILFVVPGIILAFRYLLVMQVVVIEGVTGGAALKRSRELMKTNWWNALILGILVGVIAAAIGFLQGLAPQRELAVIVGSVLQTAIFIFATAGWVVFYFSCRCKAENFDLVMLANAVGVEEPPAEGSTIAR